MVKQLTFYLEAGQAIMGNLLYHVQLAAAFKDH